MITLLRVVAALGLVFAAWLLWGARSRDDTMRAPIVRLAVKHPWLTVSGMAVTGIVIAALIVVTGIVPIKASSGHWAVTAAFLDFAKTRSVWTHSWGVHAPPLDDEDLVLKGAGHYETACLPCHGAPGRSIPPVMRAMTPTPPQLTDRVTRWTPEELFSIVKHGIKFTGMPAWPAQQRDDEVWAMVAFLTRLPWLDAAAYRRLVYGDLSDAAPAAVGDGLPPGAVRDLCSRCHGIDGTGRGQGAFPSLAGQRAAYLHAALRALRDRRRFSAVMGEIASRLNEEAMRDLAAHYARLPAREPETGKDEAAFARGRAIATAGVPERDIPACSECHGPTSLPKNPAYPKLAGQYASYLKSQLSLLQERRRGGTENVNLMHSFVNRLRQSEIHDVAEYFATLSANAQLTTGR